MRKSLLLLSCLWLSQLLSPAQAQIGFGFTDPSVRSVKIPVEIHNNLILMPVRVNSSYSFDFIVDTGVRTTLLTEPLIANLLTLKDVRPIQVRGLGEGEKIDAQIARGLRMSLPGGVEGKNMRMIILPEGAVSYSGMFGRPVVGIMGYDLFRSFVVEIDYYHKYIRLTRPDQFRAKKRHGEAFPIILRQSKPYIKAGMVDYNGDTLSTDWLVDTGASQALSIFHQEIQPPENYLDAFIGRGLSGDMFGKIGRVRQFHVGQGDAYTFNDVIAGFPDLTSIRWVATQAKHYTNLGAAVLSRFKVTFDYSRYFMYLKKNPNYNKPFEYNTAGIEVVAIGSRFERYIISYVRPNSAAEAAGVKTGDEVLIVNGQEVSAIGMQELHNLLNRKAGKKIRLKLVRDGDRISRNFVLKSSI